ncbi:DivIVA domain-containing protein [Arthrobacter agilis]|uniref:DivIVA domain-containing protein n=1 Tax=Arthrobacter agilis TaxID=37921 RepID=UPI000B351C8C|nr:DivIVA domain-containing protein [Arthrobacter agilis]OUM45399.1 cell division protein [Arthrobacter agilis]PPB46973.1 DivIVA domain-containing protein [Arthrobacter agilis]TPV23433.1 DivIVA domain-containing protein [Arthrobacter agilis]VDR31815.1 cell division protein GpsB [Arthrobacter agilis]
MALTPEDVVNKRFQPTKFREGYDQDEVDDFLDEIVVELRRLNSENEELRRTIAGGSADASSTTAVPAPVAASTQTEDLPSDDLASEEKGSEETLTATDEEPTPAPAPAASAPSTGSAESAAGVLAMAQRLHDEYVNAGVEQRDKIIAEAQIEATGLVTDAEEKSRKTLGDLEEQKSVLESKVEQLRGFERDYRARLKAYIEGQLQDLDAHGSLASDSSAS